MPAFNSLKPARVASVSGNRKRWVPALAAQTRRFLLAHAGCSQTTTSSTPIFFSAYSVSRRYDPYAVIQWNPPMVSSSFVVVPGIDQITRDRRRDVGERLANDVAEARPVGRRRPLDEHQLVGNAALGQPVMIEGEGAEKPSVEVAAMAVVSSRDNDR